MGPEQDERGVYRPTDPRNDLKEAGTEMRIEALLAATVNAENDLEKHASMSSLSSGSRDSDYDGYFYI